LLATLDCLGQDGHRRVECGEASLLADPGDEAASLEHAANRGVRAGDGNGRALGGQFVAEVMERIRT
jgi:hypothetical protein